MRRWIANRALLTEGQYEGARVSRSFIIGSNMMNYHSDCPTTRRHLSRVVSDSIPSSLSCILFISILRILVSLVVLLVIILILERSPEGLHCQIPQWWRLGLEA